MKKLAIMGAVALVIAGTMPVLADSGRSQAREWRQYERIYRGAARGDLTARELRNLAQQQRRIDRAQARAADDGYITRGERRRIERMQDRASRNIRRKNNNGRTYW
jgi:hypothetical protein